MLRAAYQAHPERFPRGVPVPPPLPTAAWINKPLTLDAALGEPSDQRRGSDGRAAGAVASSAASLTASDGGGS